MPDLCRWRRRGGNVVSVMAVESTNIIPGFYPDVDEADYHADQDSLSQSGAKLLLKSPALFRYRQDHPERKDVFDFGHAAHGLVLGVGADLVVHEYDPEKVKSPKSTKAWKERDAEVRAAGGVLLLPDEHAAVNAMAAKLSGHRLAQRLLAEGSPEVSAYAIDESTGVMRRCRYDWLGESIVTDYKTTFSAEPRSLAGMYGAVRKWRYDMQAAWYLDVAAALGHPAEAFAFIFQEKEPPYEVVALTIDEDELRDARADNAAALERFRDCTESGVWPGYLPDDELLVVGFEHPNDYTTEHIG